MDGFPCTNLFSLDLPNDFKVSEAGNFYNRIWDLSLGHNPNIAVAKPHFF